MKKTIMIIALFAVLLFTVSSRSARDLRASRGFASPELALVNVSDSSEMNLSDLKGRFVLVNFWAAYDAESRIAAHDFDRLAAETDSRQLCLLQINLDPGSRLFREIVRRDRLNEAQQFKVSARQEADVVHAFNLGSGLQSYLIDPDGEIVAVNPTPQAVADAIES